MCDCGQNWARSGRVASFTASFNELLHETLVGFIVGGRAGGSSNRFNFTLVVSRVSTTEISLLFPVHLLEAAKKEGRVVSDQVIVSYT